MKAIFVLAAFLLAALGTSAPKPQTHATVMVSADPIPICPMKKCPTLPVPR